MQTRDDRQSLIENALANPFVSIVCLSTAIPGINKHPPGIKRLFRWAVDLVSKKIVISEWQTPIIKDDLGWFAIVTSYDPVQRVKKCCVEIEDSIPAARLLDLDVYRADGQQLGRQSLGLSARGCLICDDQATHCILKKRHSSNELLAYAKHLLQTV